MTEQRPTPGSGQAPAAPDAAPNTAPNTAPNARRESMQVWEQRRAGGRVSFIWRYGVLGWGLPAALITVAYAVVQEHGLAWQGPFTSKLRVGIAMAVIVFPALGHLLGRRMWKSGEDRYRHMASKSGDHTSA